MPFVHKVVEDRPQLVEIVTPRANTAPLAAMQTCLATVALSKPFSLEIAATSESRWFLARAGDETVSRHLATALGAAYPQAELRPLDLAQHPGLDPARRREDETVAACELLLREPPYQPLRVFTDVEKDGQVDPLAGVLAAMGDLPPGWRTLSQLVLAPAPETWAKPYRRLALTPPVQPSQTQADTSLTPVFLLAGALFLGVLAVWVYGRILDHDWLPLLGVLAALAVMIWPAIRVIRRLLHKPVYDPKLVGEKIAHPAFYAQLRLAVFAPGGSADAQIEARLARLVAAYHPFNLPSGNGFQARWLRGRESPLDCPVFIGGVSRTNLLNVRELAGLWHVPRVEADVPLVERTGARRSLPLPYPVARGCRVGVSTHQGRTVEVALPDDLLSRHLLLVAKTRRGKSSLLLQMARYLMSQSASARPAALILVDPHRDLAQAALGLVPPHRRDHVVYLDVAETRRPFGLNLLDVGLGWGRDEAVGNVLSIFRREFDRFWGPRMEDAFRFALLTLYAANTAMCSVDPLGRSRQYTILDVPTLLVDDQFRARVLGVAADPVLAAWWSRYFDPLTAHLRVEIINPVQTKVQRFVGSGIARCIVGQPVSTIDPASWLRDGAIVIVNTAKGVVGEDTAALLGGTVLNLVSLAISAQASLPEARRRRATLIVDEFHTLDSVDYEAILSEQAKYGANLILATQSLARLTANHNEGGPDLRAVLFANLDGLFAFQTSAEDAKYLAPELGWGIEIDDLVSLAHYHCYAAVSVNGEKVPTFSLRLDAPPTTEATLATTLAAQSAQRWGRPTAGVEAELIARLNRQEVERRAAARPAQPPGTGQGKPQDKVNTSGPKEGDNSQGEQKRPRNDNRDKRFGEDTRQIPLTPPPPQTGQVANEVESGEEDAE